jgi:hypothetical protein
MRIRHSWLVVAACVTACNSSKPPSSVDSGGTAVIDSPKDISTSAPATDCRHDGKWAPCSIEKRLKQSGFVVKRVEDPPGRDGFTIKPIVYTLGTARLEVFVYDDSASAARDVAKLDTLTVGVVGKPSQWGDTPPTLIRSANIAAVLLSQSPRQIERAINALTAGPPQAGSPR